MDDWVIKFMKDIEDGTSIVYIVIMVVFMLGCGWLVGVIW